MPVSALHQFQTHSQPGRQERYGHGLCQISAMSTAIRRHGKPGQILEVVITACGCLRRQRRPKMSTTTSLAIYNKYIEDKALIVTALAGEK